MEKYNETFNKLVQNSHDMDGYLAYCLYKKDKQEFIEKRLNELNHGKSDSEKLNCLPQGEIDTFITAATTSTSIDTYRTKAHQIISEFLYATLKEEIENAEQKILSEYQENVKSVLPSWWHSVFASIAASLIVSLTIGLSIFLGRTSEKWVGDVVDHAIQKNEASRVSSTADTDSITIK